MSARKKISLTNFLSFIINILKKHKKISISIHFFVSSTVLHVYTFFSEITRMDEWTLTRLHFFLSFCVLLPFCNDDKNDIGPTRQQEGKAAMRKAVKKLNEKNESENFFF